MYTLSHLKKHCAEMSAQHPELKSRIWGYYDLALSEISEGDSEAIEVRKAITDIADEIEESANPAICPFEIERELRQQREEKNGVVYVYAISEVYLPESEEYNDLQNFIKCYEEKEVRKEQGAFMSNLVTKEEILQEYISKHPIKKGVEFKMYCNKAFFAKAKNIEKPKVIFPLSDLIG